MKISVNFNGKVFLLTLALISSLILGAYGVSELKDALEIEDGLRSIIQVLDSGSADGLGLVDKFALQLVGVVNEMNPYFLENAAAQAQKKKQIGILLLLLAIVIFVGSIYLIKNFLKRPSVS